MATFGTAKVKCYGLHMTENMIGRTFGRLTVTASPVRAEGRRRWVCTCECGTTGLEAFEYLLKSGKKKSCGCLRRETTAAKNRERAVSEAQIVGSTFGRLTVVSEQEQSSRGARRFRCVCSCGNGETVTELAHLRSGASQSCGCLQIEATREANKAHGKSGTTLYVAWTNMFRRVEDENQRSYKNYGGRGISICPEWHSFEAFERDMGPSHVKGMTLERIDVNGNYAPGNCTWADRTTQVRNRRTTWRIEFHGEIRPMAEWCEVLGLNYTTVRRRIRTLGWTEERALTVGANPEALGKYEERGS